MRPHLIMPMGGAGSRFYKNGFIYPKPLIEINGKPFFYWAVESINNFIEVQDITFVVLKKHIDDFSIDVKIKEYYPNAFIKVIPEVLPGPVYTALKGVEDINDDCTIIFNDCDHMFKSTSLNKLLSNKLDIDGALVTFKSNEPQFSYVKYDEHKNVIGTIEKQVVSNHAICGAYVFKNEKLFKNIAELYIKDCPYNECFMSGLYNVMCSNGLTVKDYLLDFHLEFGTPEEYEIAKSSDLFKEVSR